MFGGKVQDITHKSSEMIRDVRETSKAYGLSQKRSFDKVESSNKAAQEKKFKRLDSGSKQSHNKPGSGSSTYYNRSSGQDGNRNNSGWGNQSQGYKQHQHNQRFQKKGKILNIPNLTSRLPNPNIAMGGGVVCFISVTNGKKFQTTNLFEA